MATLVFSAIGTALGGPLGGAIGGLVGRQVDSAIFGSPSRQGPRLKDLQITTSSYGAAIPRQFGAMRVAGTMIWGTELEEHVAMQGGGKGGTALTTYTYTANFAVALSSRPITGIGRVWADGRLLRGAAGDLKVPGAMRIYTGHGDQEIDPLIATREGAERSPAFRGLAYVVFEDLDLTDFYNHIPALSFEVLAGDGVNLSDVVGEIIEDVRAQVPLPGFAGFACEGSLLDTLGQLDPLFPVDTDAGSESLIIAPQHLQLTPILVPEPAVSVEDDDFGGVAGFARHRSPASDNPPRGLRYYDVERDYLPGMQRATGRVLPGEPQTLELPAAMQAGDARDLIELTHRRMDWSRDKVAWRTTELDTAIMPGTLLALPAREGVWRVSSWEWRPAGVELSLERVLPGAASALPLTTVSPGEAAPAADVPIATSAIVAFELPWDGAGAPDANLLCAAVSGSAANWRGASLFADPGNGNLVALGPTGAGRAIVGTALGTLANAHPALFDRKSQIVVRLASDDMILADRTDAALATGANLALLGNEFIQFARAEDLGNGVWRLSGLLRGRGGTEDQTDSHEDEEPFVLIDGSLLPLDPVRVAAAPSTEILALGLGDPHPVGSTIWARGVGRRPPSPVHPAAAALADGSLSLAWTRRARGSWTWLDGVDAPLHEESERYEVRYLADSGEVISWETTEPTLSLTPAALATLPALGNFVVRQIGTYAVSTSCFLHRRT